MLIVSLLFVKVFLDAAALGWRTGGFQRAASTMSVKQVDGVRRITLNDTKTRNSLSLESVRSLLKSLTDDENNPALRCIVISGEGPVFSAGHDLKELADVSSRSVFEEFSRVMQAMVASPVPIITAVDGLAAAAGCQLVAQSDILVSTKRSTFSTPGANFGVFCSTPGIPLVRCVGPKTAAYMLFTGHPLNAEEAYKAGLVSTVVDNQEELGKEVDRITDAIKAKSRAVIELGKRFLYQQMEMSLSSAYEKGGKLMVENLSLPDGEEGLKSFVEKRKPSWKHI